MPKKRVAIGLSGGVDSAVSAHLLKEQGYEVLALYMHNWHEKQQKYCTATHDLADAQQIADHLGIELQVLDFSKEYRDEVFSEFLSDYTRGLTPNPDVLCNQLIKFKYLLNHALSVGATALATGHYAKKTVANDTAFLEIPADQIKDQTYFLGQLSQEQLKYAMFPLADLQKHQVRQIAESINLNVATKKDSTGICFIGERNFSEFLGEFLLAKPGLIKDNNGNTLGKHQGLAFFTIGQRKGLGIGGRHNSDGQPWFVSNKCHDSNTLFVVQGSHHRSLYREKLLCDRPILNALKDLPSNHITARIRHRGDFEQCCEIKETAEGLEVRFSKPVRAITPGQFIVFYHENRCLGGAKIIQ